MYFVLPSRLGRVGAAVALLVFLVLGVISTAVGLHVRQAMADGSPGSFTPQRQHCELVTRRSSDGHSRSRDECTWTGTFRSVETTMIDVTVLDDLGTRRGDSAPAPVAAVRGSDGQVYLDRASNWLVWLIVGGGFVTISLAILVVLLVVGRRRRRSRGDGGGVGYRPGEMSHPVAVFDRTSDDVRGFG